ncbi:HlyD family type I secretion periplasmic adaptor subunit [Marinobacterium marinum]|uniref:Membrane fusion protein (MFP) family protein n=1 Tax=Marinobacterium marinum TaxID=2756129 RepID=A0A7W1WYW4_9GAMM|nr:HlyD family type I secretion periplasmic adaptor subunit [Marinobacterium marinum]MBA4502779.1 HlyD family type I secretion periplasmic adaptor subunit [Marinobacterium marinum]
MSERRHAEEKGFAGLERLAAPGQRSGRIAGALMRPLLSRLPQDAHDWSKEAEFSIVESREPGARGLLYTILIAFVLLLVWSAMASIEEVTRGEGKVIPARQLQIVQSPDGGVVRELHVSEGDKVEAGDLLVKIDPTRFVANFQETEVRIFALQAKVERLNALLNDEHWQPEQGATPEQRAVLQREKAFFAESLSEYQQGQAVAGEQLSQQQRGLQEAQAKVRAARQEVRLSGQELRVTRPLLESGAVSEVDLLRLERDLAAASGELRRAEAETERQRAAVEEAEARIGETRHAARNRWRTELSDASAELSGLKEGAVALADRVKAAELRAPVSGTVQRVLYNTTGGVIGQGDAVVEIVPADDRLLVEAKIAPRDIAFLRPGLPATIKLHAYDFSIYGGIPAEVQHISADTITDKRDNTYYLVRAITNERALSDALEVMPGMTAQLDIITGERSVLSYLLKPILRAKANALGER